MSPSRPRPTDRGSSAVADTTERAPVDVDARLTRVESAIEQVFCEIRPGGDVARRVITRELGFDPSPGLLRAIVRLAGQSPPPGRSASLERRLLALHVLVDRELGRLLDAPSLDPERLRDQGNAVVELERRVCDAEADLRKVVAAADVTDRAELLEIADALALARQRLVAATVLAPRLVLLAEELAGGDPEAAVPALTPAERALLTRTTGFGADGSTCCRASVNAIALRTLIEEDLERYASLSTRPRGSVQATRNAVLDRLRRDEQAHRIVSARLRERQEAAIAAGLESFAAEIGRIKNELFVAYLKLRPAVDAVPNP